VCNKGLLLENGVVKADADIDAALDAYLDSQLTDLANTFTALQNEYIDIHGIKINTGEQTIPWSKTIIIQLDLAKKKSFSGSRLIFRLQNQVGQNILNCFTEALDREIAIDATGTLRIQIPGKVLSPGVYTISVQLLQSGYGQVIRQTTIGRFIIFSESDYPELLMADSVIAPPVEMQWS
jgi:hypothetical protein